MLTKEKLFLPTIFLALIIILSACQSATSGEAQTAAQEPTAITVMLDWVPNTNHTGLFVAQEKGWYEENGLAVNIIQPGETGVEQAVASGSAEFGISYQEGVTMARAEEVPIVSIAAVIQHNTSGFASRAEEGIEGPQDFEGKTYGSFGSPVEKPILDLLMSCAGGDVELTAGAARGADPDHDQLGRRRDASHTAGVVEDRGGGATDQRSVTDRRIGGLVDRDLAPSPGVVVRALVAGQVRMSTFDAGVEDGDLDPAAGRDVPCARHVDTGDAVEVVLLLVKGVVRHELWPDVSDGVGLLGIGDVDHLRPAHHRHAWRPGAGQAWNRAISPAGPDHAPPGPAGRAPQPRHYRWPRSCRYPACPAHA